jgi:uncharacterized protein YbaA (DUF1428 family)
MLYIDGFVLPVPKNNTRTVLAVSQIGLFMKHCETGIMNGP